MLSEEIGVEERQLHRVGDLLDLSIQTTDVFVGDVRHLFEQQILDLGARQLLEQKIGSRIEAHRVTAAQVHPAEAVGQFADSLFVGTPRHHRAHAVVHDLLDRDDLAGDLGMPGEDDVEALVQHHLGSPLERLLLDVGVQADPHLAATREHVDRAVFVASHDHAVGRRRLAELVDLVTQGGDVLASFTQRVAELLVLAHRVGELALGLEQAFLERAHPLGSVCDPPTKVGDLLVEHDRLRTKLLERFGVVVTHRSGIASLVARFVVLLTVRMRCGGHGWNLHAREPLPHEYNV